MHDCMLHTTYVDVDRHPVDQSLLAYRLVNIVGIQVSEEVPRGVNERIKRIDLSSYCTTWLVTSSSVIKSIEILKGSTALEKGYLIVIHFRKGQG